MKIDEIIDDFLSIEKKTEEVKPSFFDRIKNLSRRRDIEKSLQDEREHENAKILKLGNDAKVFLNSSYYRDFIEPQLRWGIKGGIQNILAHGEDMTEAKLKSEIACIRRYILFFDSIKRKIAQSDSVRDTLARVK